jgi:hypothetical protein
MKKRKIAKTNPDRLATVKSRWMPGDPPLPVGGFCEKHHEHYKSAVCVPCRRNAGNVAGSVVASVALKTPFIMVVERSDLEDAPVWAGVVEAAESCSPTTDAGAAGLAFAATIVLAGNAGEQAITGGVRDAADHAVEVAQSILDKDARPLAGGRASQEFLGNRTQEYSRRASAIIRWNRRHVFTIADALMKDPATLNDPARFAELTDGIVYPTCV